MLEWYRVGFDHHDLMQEMDELLRRILSCPPAVKMTYQQAFQQVFGLCPLEATMAELKKAANSIGLNDIAEAEEERDTLLQLLFSVRQR